MRESDPLPHPGTQKEEEEERKTRVRMSKAPYHPSTPSLPYLIVFGGGVGDGGGGDGGVWLRRRSPEAPPDGS